MKTFALVLLMLILLASCEFDKPGSRGRNPMGDLRPSVELLYHINEELPDKFTCGEEYFFKTRAEELTTACSTFTHWDFLYEEATAQMQNKFSTIACPRPECEHHNMRIVEQVVGCDGNDLAFIELGASLRCQDQLPSDSELPRLADPSVYPTTNQLQGVSFPLQLRERVTSTVTRVPQAGACPGIIHFRVDLTEPADCNEIETFEAYVNYTLAQGPALRERAGCQNPCIKGDIEEVYLKWDCQNNLVTITYIFSVRCLVE